MPSTASCAPALASSSGGTAWPTPAAAAWPPRRRRSMRSPSRSTATEGTHARAREFRSLAGRLLVGRAKGAPSRGPARCGCSEGAKCIRKRGIRSS
eukprot:3643646-Prymnesium_polylepis.1